MSVNLTRKIGKNGATVVSDKRDVVGGANGPVVTQNQMNNLCSVSTEQTAADNGTMPAGASFLCFFSQLL